ncbi:glycine--tRNA ligase subunit beta [bacterium]|nr:glycine--tRNA ligase subunit beta [bacterium]
MSETSGRRPFLLEIGSEEIPARFIPTAMTAIVRQLSDLLAHQHLAHSALEVLATPRRLTVRCDELAARQPDREDEVKGPPVSVAFDAEGRPTKAAEGFARKVGLDLDQCDRGEDARGEFLLARRLVEGRPAAEVLADGLPGLVLGLPFRKTMRWGSLDIEYARPLQWLVCLLGDEVVPVAVGDLTAGRTTRGHRTLTDDARREIPSCTDYDRILAELSVVADPAERRRRIEAGAAELLAAWPEPAELRPDTELLDEVVFLCEHPTVFVGEYPVESFELPEEVIVTALKAHQRYFAVDAADGAGLRPCFVAVRDGGRDHLDGVRAGNERVLRARLADALFYWRFDQQKTPDEHAAALGDVTWLEGFGSVADHTRRSARLAERLWTLGLGEGAVPTALARAAALSRFDLVTEMIKDGKEFTKLEGVIAARYAAAAGEDDAVCRILEQSLQPRSAQDTLPDVREARVLSAAWRLDTLAGCWLAGFAPTGTKDPYQLRRHTLALLRIILESGVSLDLRALIDEALAPFVDRGAAEDPSAARQQLLDFVTVRLAGHLQETADADPDVLRAILPVRGHDPADARAWVQALDGFRERDDFLRLARGFKRCTNILKGDVLGPQQRDETLARWGGGGRGADGEDFTELGEDAEVALRDAVAAGVDSLAESEAGGDYVAVFQTLSGLGPLIDRYFDEVRVNTDDEAVRRVRLAFLREIHALFLHFADFAQVAPDED